jgi:hypothetical protein
VKGSSFEVLRNPAAKRADRLRTLSPIATPTLAESEVVEKIPKGRFWIGKSEFAGISSQDLRDGLFASIIVRNYLKKG